MLEVRDVNVAYRGIRAVRDVSIDVPDGALTCIVGRNGAGKSSLVGAIAGIVRSGSGSIRLDGRELSRRSPAARARAGLALVPESRRIFATLSARENVVLGGPQRRRDCAERYDQVRELFPVLTQLESRPGGALSGGEQQMVAIARALMRQPTVLILDEPSLGLAPIIVERVMSAVEELARGGQAILLIEQNAKLALRMSQSAYVMSLGRLTRLGEQVGDLDDEKIMALYS